MSKIAVISDIHANLEALTTVMTDIKQNDISDIISLGDNVGYGPNPVEVLKLLQSYDVITLEGNHDLAVVNPQSFFDASDLATAALEWTRRQLWEAGKADNAFQEVLQNYLGCEKSLVLEDICFVHGSPGPNNFDYLLHPQDISRAAKYIRSGGHRICFYGHTHQQMFWEVDRAWVSVIEFEYDSPVIFTQKELSKTKLFINPGSVGQPRDGNPKAGYVIYEHTDEEHSFTFKRLSYDMDTTQRKIYAEEELDKSLGDRLFFGA